MTPFFWLGTSMNKSRVTIVGIIAAILVVVLLGLFFFRWQSEERLPSEPEQGTSTAVDLGVTYVPVTPGLSAYYDLGVDSGALVTEVIPDSSADRAGVKVGDVILSFNGATVEEEIPLLGMMMMACPAGGKVVLEVWREKGTEIVELVHTER